MWTLLLACMPPTGSTPVDWTPPDDLPAVEVVSVDPARSEVVGGTLLVGQFFATGSYAVALDGEAHPIWWAAPPAVTSHLMRVRLGRDGRSVLFGERHRDNSIDAGMIRRVDIQTGVQLSQTRGIEHHHDFIEGDDGRITFLSRDRRPNLWFPEDPDAPLGVDVVRTIEEGTPDPDATETLFHLLDDLDVDPFWSCEHMASDQFLTGTLDWTHANSLALDRETGEWTLMVRHWNAVIRLNPDRTVKWQIGGPGNDMTPLGGAEPPRHGHMTEAWSDGMLVFDNGNHVEGAVSRALEYAIDEAAMTYEVVWSFDDPEGLFHIAKGDVRRLPGGNTLVSWTPVGRLTEITPDGDIVWQAETVDGTRIGRSEFVPDWP